MVTMSFEQAIDAIKERTEDYLRTSRGVILKGHYANGTSRAFKCISPSHDDKTPSMFYSYSKHCAICRTCKARYGIFDMIGEDYNLSDFKEQVKKGAEIYGIQIDSTPRRSRAEEDFRPMDGQNRAKTGQNTDTQPHTDVYTHKEEADYTAYFDECKRRIAETDYHRGLSLETLERHYIGFDPCFKTRDQNGNFVTWRALIIPTSKGSFAARNTDANVGHGDRYRKRGATQIFAYKTLQTASKPIFVVEGEIDSLSIEEAGGAAIGLGSYDNVPLLLKLLEAKKPSQPLIIAFDAEAELDKQQRVDEAEKKLSDGLERLSIPYYRLRPFVGYHDANEALTMDREAFTEAIAGAENIEKQAEEEERTAYLASNTAAYLQQFINGIAESVNTEAIPTGFETLDAVLDGGLYEGLYTIGAISSLGKTSLVLQVADMVAASGHDVLIFSLEMARAELMSKSISRHTLQIAMRDGIDTRNAKTARGITDGKRHINYSRAENELIRAAITAYGAYAERLYILEGVGDIGTEQIRETVEKHIRFTGRRPLVIVDYMQIVAPYNERATDKQNTDKCVLELKRISRDFKLPIIAISSFNRTNYREAVSMEAFKESGAVEYSSDTLIGLQFKGAGKKDFDPTEEKRKDPRQIELVILKNRQGKVGDKILFEYYPMFNYFIDKGLSK